MHTQREGDTQAGTTDPQGDELTVFRHRNKLSHGVQCCSVLN